MSYKRNVPCKNPDCGSRYFTVYPDELECNNCGWTVRRKRRTPKMNATFTDLEGHVVQCTKGQLRGIEALRWELMRKFVETERTEALEQALWGDQYVEDPELEVKHLSVMPCGPDLSVVIEVGHIGDEDTMASVFARERVHAFIGPRGSRKEASHRSGTLDILQVRKEARRKARR